MVATGSGTNTVPLPPLGQQVSAASLPVVIASDQSPIPVAGTFTATFGGTTAVNIVQVGGSAIALGQTTMIGSLPVVIASNQSAIPVTGSFSATNPAVGTTGNAVPGSADYIGIAVAGNLQGWVGVNVPTINATANIARIDLSSLNGTGLSIGQALMAASIPVVIASNQAAITAVVSGTVSISGSSSTTAVNITQVSGSAIALGQATMASSFPVVISSNQSTLTAFVSGGNITAVVSGTVSISGSSATTAVNITQVGGSTISLGQVVMASSFPVVIASDQSVVAIKNKSSTGTITTAAATTNSITLLSLNTARIGATIVHSATSALYVLLGSGTVNTSSLFSVAINPGVGSYYELPYGYQGPISGLWNAASNGTAVLTELS